MNKLFFLLLLFSLINIVRANGLVPTPEEEALDMFIMITIYISAFFFTVFTEFIVIYLFLKRTVSWKKVLLSVLIINSITYFPTQILAYSLNSIIQYHTLITSHWLFIFAPLAYIMPLFGFYSLAEALPFVCEYFLLKWQFHSLNKKELIKLTIVANTVSFVIGTLLFTFLMYIIV